jgi:HK97 family phage major capsid protein
MAITAATLTSDFSGFFPAVVAKPIFEAAARMSVVQQVVRQHPVLPDRTTSIPVVTGRPIANWVSEGGIKPATEGSMELVNLIPKKLACTVAVSAEVLRSDPGGYVTTLESQLAEAFAIAFDLAALHGLDGAGTAAGPFATYIDQTTRAHELGGTSQANGGVYGDIVQAIQELVASTDTSGRHHVVNGFLLDNQMEPRLLASVDTTGRPLWVDLPADQFSNGLSRTGSLLGRRSFMSDGVADPNAKILGYAGDWSKAVWGVVGGISFRTSTEATMTINSSLQSLWERNLVGIIAEAEYAFVVADTGAFLQLRNDTGS